MHYRNENGEWKELILGPSGDTLPIDSIVEFDGDVVPTGWEKVVEKIPKYKVLYENETGTNGNVTLSENIGNRTIEVFYHFKNSATLTVCGSRKFSNPVGKLITLGIGDGHYDSGSFYGKYGSYTANDNELTVRTKGGYYYGTNNGFNNTENVLYITKVVAYEEV